MNFVMQRRGVLPVPTKDYPTASKIRQFASLVPVNGVYGCFDDMVFYAQAVYDLPLHFVPVKWRKIGTKAWKDATNPENADKVSAILSDFIITAHNDKKISLRKYDAPRHDTRTDERRAEWAQSQ